jgi:hypothetical protein
MILSTWYTCFVLVGRRGLAAHVCIVKWLLVGCGLWPVGGWESSLCLLYIHCSHKKKKKKKNRKKDKIIGLSHIYIYIF